MHTISTSTLRSFLWRQSQQQGKYPSYLFQMKVPISVAWWKGTCTSFSCVPVLNFLYSYDHFFLLVFCSSRYSRERNREHARKTRQRKKAQLEILKDKLSKLQQEVLYILHPSTWILTSSASSSSSSSSLSLSLPSFFSKPNIGFNPQLEIRGKQYGKYSCKYEW